MVLVSSFCFLRTRWDVAVMELPSPNDSSLFSYVQVTAYEEMMQFLKYYFPYISRFLRFFFAVYSNLLRRISLLTAASPCCRQSFRPSIYPCIYVHVQLQGVQKIIAPVNSTRESPYDESKLSCDGISTDILGGKRSESWMGCGNTVHFARSYTLPENVHRLELHPGMFSSDFLSGNAVMESRWEYPYLAAFLLVILKIKAWVSSETLLNLWRHIQECS